MVLSPADGKIVVIEKTYEAEYFKEDRLMISIFMSLWDVHANRFPVSGIIRYYRYHPGRYLVARNPKSSIENERTTVVIEDERNRMVLFRQIAGIVARRIVGYMKEDEHVIQGEQCGFIKFGSRVDVFLPLNTELRIKLGDRVKGGLTTLASI
jgi:phosphatidylserine decarboxylase